MWFVRRLREDRGGEDNNETGNRRRRRARSSGRTCTDLFGGLALGVRTTDTVASAPVTSSATQAYSASYDLVKAAALASVQRLNVDIQGSDETSERFQIRFSKAISAFSWGEVGVVNVVRVDDHTTHVYVHATKRD